MKKNRKSKRLLFSSERVRDLQPREMKRASGGLCAGDSFVGDPAPAPAAACDISCENNSLVYGCKVTYAN